MIGGEWGATGPSGTLSKKCVNCAGNLTYDAVIGSLVCHMCGKIYESGSLKENGSFGLAFREKEYEKDEDVEAEDLDKVEFVCDSCGAQIVTDKNTTATFCAFCGSPTLISRRLTRQFKPNMIIPFKVSKDEAMSLYDEFLRSSKKVPKDFRSAKVRERLKGIYMPAWLVSAKCKTDMSANGKRQEGNVEAFYDLGRVISYSLENVPFSGSKKLSQRMLEAVEPFDMEDAAEFTTAYLQGFYAYKYDNLPENMIKTIEDRFDDYGTECGKMAWDSRFERESERYLTALTGVNVKYCLVPVWFMCYEYKGLYYHFVVNGQTGEVCGRLPEKENLITRILTKISNLSPLIVSALITVPVAVVIYFLMALVAEDYAPSSMMFWLTWMCFIVCTYVAATAIYGFIRKTHIDRQIAGDDKPNPHELDKRPGVDQYYAYGEKIEVENRDHFTTGYATTGDYAARNYHFM
ncbi:MAG: hypothetical protein J5778_08900 [Clostridiales bacterium]|nr:hypothetical protein [Clostridiales bacterium]